MLVKGQIPSHEPVVSIGLVLPEDRVKKLVIMDVENNRSFNINLSEEPNYFPTSTYKLSSIRAGRGFHWEKNISITDQEAREHIYGMPYSKWKEKYQK